MSPPTPTPWVSTKEKDSFLHVRKWAEGRLSPTFCHRYRLHAHHPPPETCPPIITLERLLSRDVTKLCLNIRMSMKPRRREPSTTSTAPRPTYLRNMKGLRTMTTERLWLMTQVSVSGRYLRSNVYKRQKVIISQLPAGWANNSQLLYFHTVRRQIRFAWFKPQRIVGHGMQRTSESRYPRQLPVSENSNPRCTRSRELPRDRKGV